LDFQHSAPYWDTLVASPVTPAVISLTILTIFLLLRVGLLLIDIFLLVMLHLDVGFVSLLICEKFGALLTTFEVVLIFFFFGPMLLLLTHII